MTVHVDISEESTVIVCDECPSFMFVFSNKSEAKKKARAHRHLHASKKVVYAV